MSIHDETRSYDAVRKPSPEWRESRPKPAMKTRQKLGMPKPKRWSHQHDLDASLGKRITLLVQGGRPIEGTLIAADQYTLKIESNGLTWENDSLIIAPKSKSILTIFKSSIEVYFISGE